MKTLEEKIKICTLCKNRELSKEQGIICSLTKEKPDFEESCINCIPDKQEYERLKERNLKQEEEKKISGWLALFLWIGIGGGAVISIFNAISTLSTGEFAIPVYLVFPLSYITLIITAILTIIAFYKQKTNAVSLAKTYIAMIVFDAIANITVAIVTEDTSLYMQILKQAIWAGTWFTYIQQSEKVQAIVPSEKRTWNKLEKILLAIFIAATTTITAAVTYMSKSTNAANILFTNNSYITNCIAETQKSLPLDYGNGVILTYIKNEGSTIVYTYKIKDLYPDSYITQDFKEEGEVIKYETMNNIFNDQTNNSFETLCLKEGYTVEFRYLDATNQLIYSIIMTPDEYNKATAEGVYKCPIEKIEELIDTYNQYTPVPEYIENITLEKIHLSEDKGELIYELTLPRLSIDEINYLTSARLKDMIIECWSELRDSMNRLAIVNQMSICYNFKTYNGKEFSEVKITPNIYNGLDSNPDK